MSSVTKQTVLGLRNRTSKTHHFLSFTQLYAGILHKLKTSGSLICLILSTISSTLPGPTLPMATVDIKNPEISNVHRYQNNSQVNNIVHSTFPKREKKGGKGKKKRLTKADIGTPSNFQWVAEPMWLVHFIVTIANATRRRRRDFILVDQTLAYKS